MREHDSDANSRSEPVSTSSSDDEEDGANREAPPPQSNLEHVQVSGVEQKAQEDLAKASTGDKE